MSTIKHAVLMIILTSLYLSAPASAENIKVNQSKLFSTDIENGAFQFQACTLCHSPDGWGTPDGYYPQLSGQLTNVLIKQLLDIEEGHREVPTMTPFAKDLFSQTEEDVIDLVAYISILPKNPNNSRGNGKQLIKGKELYMEYCEGCHGENAEGNNDKDYPLLQGQHYEYTLRQLRLFRQDKRKNGNPEMQNSLKTLSDNDFQAIADYISRLKPRSNLLASNSH